MARDVFDAIGDLPIGDIFNSNRRLVLNSPIGTAVLFAFLEKRGNPARRAIIAPNQYQAQKIYEALLSFLPEEKVLFFPSDELLRAEAVSSSKELMASIKSGLSFENVGVVDGGFTFSSTKAYLEYKETGQLPVTGGSGSGTEEGGGSEPGSGDEDSFG